MKKLLFLINPISGQKNVAPKLFEIIDLYQKSGYEVTVHISQSGEDVNDIYLNRSADYDLMVCAGGDGTLNEAIDALIRSGNHPDFAYIPGGTVNDFATTHQIPKKAVPAARLVLDGSAKPCDIGLFGDRSFVYVAAFGTLADVSYSTNQKLKNVIGKAAYILKGASLFFSMKSYQASISFDGNTYEGEFIAGIFSTSVSVGGFSLPILSVADVYDGMMEVLLVRKPKSFVDAIRIVSCLFSKRKKCDSVIFAKTQHVSFSAPLPVPFTVDGEYAGSPDKIDIEMRQGVVSMIVKENPRRSD